MPGPDRESPGLDVTEFLETLRRTPATLRSIVREHDLASLRARPSAGKWSPNEILGHLVDHEIVSACRIRTSRLEEQPWLSRYDQERWVTIQDHHARDPEEFVQRFSVLRALNVEQYQTLSSRDLQRSLRRADGTEVTLDRILRAHVAHDLRHLDQLQRYLSAGEP